MLNLVLPEVGLQGRYKFVVRRHGKVRLVTPWFDNLITDIGLEAFGDYTKAVAKYCVLGTGNTAPANGNTTLESPVAIRDDSLSVNSTGIVTSPNRFGWQRKTYPFAQGAVVGNIAEVGVGWTNSISTSVMSRSLVTPAASIFALDQLTVIYEIRMFLPTVDVTGSVTDGANTYNFTIKPLCATNNGLAGYQQHGWCPSILYFQSAGIGPRQWVSPNSPWFGCNGYEAPVIATPITEESLWKTTGVPASSDYADSVTNLAYVGSSKQARFNTTFGIARGNFAAGMQGFLFSGVFGTYQCILDVPVVKDNTKTLQLNWQQSWARRP